MSAEPLTVSELAAAAEAPPERVERALDALAERHAEGRSGVVLERVAGGFGFRAAATTAEACARLLQRAPDRQLTPAALETLAVIAYLQPVARPEIARIRGVSADAAVAGLLERGIIEEAGRTDERGGAVLYRTTSVFDRVFGLEHGLDGSAAAARRSATSTSRICASVCTPSRPSAPARPQTRAAYPARVADDDARINKFLASAGFGSRRAVEDLVERARASS